MYLSNEKKMENLFIKEKKNIITIEMGFLPIMLWS